MIRINIAIINSSSEKPRLSVSIYHVTILLTIQSLFVRLESNIEYIYLVPIFRILS